MKFSTLQVRILSALVRHEHGRITEEQMAARLVIPFNTFRYELYRLRSQTRQRTTPKLTNWWKKERLKYGPTG